MPKEFINPNWHLILIHYPLGVFFLGMLLELACLFLRHHGTFRSAARWMVVLGALSGLPAAYAGAYALSDVVRRTAPSAPDDAPWHAVEADSSLDAQQWELLGEHAWTNGGIAVISAVVVTLAVACTDRWRRRLYPLFLLLLLGCLAYMSVGAYAGGEMVYRTGLAVKLPHREHERTLATTRPDSPAAELQLRRPPGVAYYVNPLQTHVTLAGFAAALGMLGIGLSLRAAATSPHWRDPELDRAGVNALPHPQRGGAQDMAVLRSFAPQVQVTGETERVPAARIWLLTFVVTVLASLAGWWVLGHGHETYRPRELWELVTADGYVRRRAHVVAAGAIIVLPLLMAMLARVARRSRLTITLFGIFLVAVTAAQVWVGSLLMFDQPRVPEGAKWYRLQEAAAPVVAAE